MKDSPAGEIGGGGDQLGMGNWLTHIIRFFSSNKFTSYSIYCQHAFPKLYIFSTVMHDGLLILTLQNIRIYSNEYSIYSDEILNSSL